MAECRVVYVVRSFPRLSQTFILNELLAIEAMGIDVHVVSMVHAREQLTHPRLALLRADVIYLDDLAALCLVHRARTHLAVAAGRPLRYLRAALRLARRPDAVAGYHGITRRQAFDHGVQLVGAVGLHRRSTVVRLHAHFAHDPTLVAQVASAVSGVPFSFTGHARDLVQISPKALAERVADASAVLTICETNAELLRAVSAPVDRHKVHVVYNGIDTAAFTPRLPAATHVAGSVVSVGRFVDKKGFEVLLDALAAVVRSGTEVHLTIYGDGPLRPLLEARIAALALADHVTLAGECTQDELQQVLPSFALFALTPYISDDGDRDGLPTVLVEAMSCGLPVVTTDVAGISDLVQHGVNGLLCPPRQVAPVADALRALLADPSRCARLGAAARQTVLDRFAQSSTARRVADLLIGP